MVITMNDLHAHGGAGFLRLAEALMFSLFFAVVLTMFAGPAGAIAQQRAQGITPLIIRDTPQDDPCRALLVAVSYSKALAPSLSAAGPQRAVRGHEARARAVAALGLALGAHYALGPREAAQAGGPGSETTPALAISAWRQCRNDHVLRTQ